ncbi:hypothetical protein A3F05_03670 [Candidatus Saccharibacteria bacterium RIFCSPHIGHO2_12_FULL_47_17]|nr:MAG: hypothetical protein A3F05_03670 [Candidatus Saccharibacteria bacterium RIFCSPHIGHO2_12_FULL_47_17]
MEAITPLGPDKDSSWTNLISGKHGFVPLSELPFSKMPGMEVVKSKIVAPVHSDFDFDNYPSITESLSPRQKRSIHRSGELVTAAMYQALCQPNLIGEGSCKINSIIDPWRVSSYVGTAFSGAHTLAEVTGRAKTSDLFNTLYGRAATAPAMILGIKGAVSAVSTECASSSGVVHDGLRSLWRKPWGAEPDADILVIGGTESVLSPKPIEFFESLQVAVDTRDVDEIDIVSRALDKDRRGLIFGEGAGALVITSLKKARELGIKDEDIIAEIVGSAHLTEAETETLNGEEGQERVVYSVLEQAGVTAGELGYINGHLTATPGGDESETRATRKALAELGLKPENFYYGSTKSSTGHNLGAAGVIEAIFAIMALRGSVIPPPRNLENPIDEAEEFMLNMNWSAENPTKAPISVAVSNNFGFGGSAVALAFRKFQP